MIGGFLGHAEIVMATSTKSIEKWVKIVADKDTNRIQIVFIVTTSSI